jgi:hypothetical protein
MKLPNKIFFDQKFNSSLKKIINLDLPVKDSLALARLLHTMKSEGSIVAEIKDKLLAEYEVTFEGNRMIVKDPEKSSEFISKVEELLNLEFEISLDNKIKLTPENCKGVISTSDILNLEPILQVD